MRHKNDSCTLLQEKLVKDFSWLACRRHSREVLCRHVLKAIRWQNYMKIIAVKTPRCDLNVDRSVTLQSVQLTNQQVSSCRQVLLGSSSFSVTNSIHQLESSIRFLLQYCV